MSAVVRRSPQSSLRAPFAIERFVIAGWTGRDRNAVEKHIRELEEIGVQRPSATPIFYRVAASRVTTAPVIEVIGDASSGEVEFCLYRSGTELWVGVGSDHTDRDAEKINVTLSKQLCDKPIAPELWNFKDVCDQWDRLILRSYIAENGERRLYQEGTVGTMLHPDELLRLFGGSDAIGDKSLMMCGTLAAKGGIRPSSRFEFELYDPVLQRTISSGYDIRSLPDVK